MWEKSPADRFGTCNVLFSQEAPCAIHKELTTLISTMTVLSEELWKRGGENSINSVSVKLNSFFLPLFSNADVISKHLQQQLLGETRHLLPSPFSAAHAALSSSLKTIGAFLSPISYHFKSPALSNELLRMVFAGKKTLEKLFFLFPRWIKRGRRGGRGEKKKSTTKIRTQKLPKMHHSFSTSTNAEMSSRANARARHTQKKKTPLRLSLGDSLFSWIC